MRHATDSFNSAPPQRGEWRIVAVLLFALLSMEGSIRWWVSASETRVQCDDNNVRSLVRVAEEMKSYDGHKVLLVGNSLTRDGVDPAVLRGALRSAGRKNPGVFPCHPSGTSACTWDYALARYFLRPDILPDEIFIFAGPAHLSDNIEDATRLRNFFVHPGDLHRAWSWDLRGSEERIRFLAAQVSQLSGLDPMLKLRLLDRIVPHFTEMEQVTNRLIWERIRLATQQQPPAEFRHLTFLLDALRERQIRTHIVMMPVIYQAAPINPKAADVIASHSMDLLDLSKMPAIESRHFSDGFHLNRDGARVFSEQLASEIIARFR